MLVARPYASDAHLLATAEELWWALEPADWLEAFEAHPRIGEKAEPHDPTAGWSAEEQAGVAGAAAATRAALETGNRAYESKFGHVFLVCATGRSAEELRSDLQRRLENEPDLELRVAAGEQAKITRLRLERLGKS